MSRIPTPATLEAAPEASKPTLEAIKRQIGALPNVFRMMSNSPAVLEAYAALNGALGKGNLDKKIRERIALAIAQINGCEYCLAAHTYTGTHVAKLSLDEILAARRGGSSEARADAAVKFAVRVAEARGGVSNEEVEAVKAAGFDDGELLEIVAHVAASTFTNYMNEVFKTDVDFPKVDRQAA
ncbi:carboxymuconolactone decarboxylase family protein [Rhizobium leguminosarum]|uniref:carboxymuconolactone decarboxylase family protein n=1 Tax=Rhizobium leguminosarum TaxID=384 RepID=UPI00102F4DB8|nr:carboxymuconolactone decarboxylase family protein [Rhizobium leguminosarum]TAX38934.1 carboxymuconolactone decarboxylase family protein [Rhizobium leguminosarum]